MSKIGCVNPFKKCQFTGYTSKSALKKVQMVLVEDTEYKYVTNLKIGLICCGKPLFYWAVFKLKKSQLSNFEEGIKSFFY